MQVFSLPSSSSSLTHLWQRGVVEEPGSDGVQRQVELVVPAELKAGLAQLAVPCVRMGVALREKDEMGGGTISIWPEARMQ